MDTIYWLSPLPSPSSSQSTAATTYVSAHHQFVPFYPNRTCQELERSLQAKQDSAQTLDEPFLSDIAALPHLDFSASRDPEVRLLRHIVEGMPPRPIIVDNEFRFRPTSSELVGDDLSVSPMNSRRHIEIHESHHKRKRQKLNQDAASTLMEDITRLAPCEDLRPATLAIYGESRLKIRFDHFGRIGPIPQRFGKSGLWLADGLCGTHDMYEQPWRFEVKQGQKIQDDVALITWTITNLSSGVTTSVTETVKQARIRQYSGRTICNRVLNDALTQRYSELELLLATLEDNPIREANVKSLMKVIAPRRCTVGLLFFGLLHECVQKPLRNEVSQMRSHDYTG